MMDDNLLSNAAKPILYKYKGHHIKYYDDLLFK